MKVINKHIFQVFLFAVRSMEQIKSNGLVLSEKNNRKYESLLDLAFLKVYPSKFYQVSDYRLSRASSYLK
jgi:phage terminase Nu1 subunit (DNA packaging protein)